MDRLTKASLEMFFLLLRLENVILRGKSFVFEKNQNIFYWIFFSIILTRKQWSAAIRRILVFFGSMRKSLSHGNFLIS